MPVCVHVFVCVHEYAFACKCVHTHVGVHVCVCTCMWMHVCVCACIFVWMHAYVHTCTCVYLCVHAHVCIHPCACVFEYMCMCLHAHMLVGSVYMCMWMHTCIMHAPVCVHACGGAVPSREQAAWCSGCGPKLAVLPTPPALALSDTKSQAHTPAPAVPRHPSTGSRRDTRRFLPACAAGLAPPPASGGGWEPWEGSPPP